jgi:hypothetical protein
MASDVEAETLLLELIRAGDRVLAQIEQEATGRLATVRMAPPGNAGKGGVVVDLIFASSGIEPELAAAADRVEVFPCLALPAGRAGSTPDPVRPRRPASRVAQRGTRYCGGSGNTAGASAVPTSLLEFSTGLFPLQNSMLFSRIASTRIAKP